MKPPTSGGIDTRTRLHILYGGMLRLVEPYACGYSGAGEALLFAYQLAGESESGGLPDWRTFRMDRMQMAELDMGTFYARPDFTDDIILEMGKIRRIVARVW